MKSRNYWPHTVVTMIVLCVIACAWTIKIALDNPVQMSNLYMDKYQAVDDNINTILIQTKQFDEKYRVGFPESILNIGKNDFSFKLNTLDGLDISNANLKLLLTRPETREFDQVLDNLDFKNGFYEAKNLDIPKVGRWIVRLKIEIDDLVAFKNIEYMASKLH